MTERFNRILRGFDLGTPSPIEAQARAAYTTAFNANPANFPRSPSEFRVLGGYTFADENNRNVGKRIAVTSNRARRFLSVE